MGLGTDGECSKRTGMPRAGPDGSPAGNAAESWINRCPRTRLVWNGGERGSRRYPTPGILVPVLRNMVSSKAVTNGSSPGSRSSPAHLQVVEPQKSFQFSVFRVARVRAALDPKSSILNPDMTGFRVQIKIEQFNGVPSQAGQLAQAEASRPFPGSVLPEGVHAFLPQRVDARQQGYRFFIAAVVSLGFPRLGPPRRERGPVLDDLLDDLALGELHGLGEYGGEVDVPLPAGLAFDELNFGGVSHLNLLARSGLTGI